MLLNETWLVDYRIIQRILDQINRKFAVDEGRVSGEGPERLRRVIAKWGNRDVQFVESDGISWTCGVRVNLEVIRPEYREHLLMQIAEAYFAQDWS